MVVDRGVDESDIATDPWKAATASLLVLLANAAVLLCCLPCLSTSVFV